MVVFWWIYRDRAVADRANDGRPVPWIIALLITNIGTLTLLQWIVTDRIVFFWAFGVGMNSGGNYLEVFIDSLFDRNLWYVFIWLAPLGAIELRKFPKPWLGATFAGIGMAFLLNSYYGGAPGTVGRAVFSVAGPLLSLSAGLYLSVLRLRTVPQQ
jgi:hypothetical protein